jgi:uncharacterized protein YecE (DUF72 family)
MEFGQIPYTELDKIDFSLPTDPPFNKEVFSKEFKGTKVYVGLAKWGRPEWVGKLYPPKTNEKDFLKEYIKHFNSIEYNSSHYKIYGFANSQKKAAIANGNDFLFFPKMFQGITHRGSLKGKSFLINEFCRGIVGFEKHLGSVFIQLSDSFSSKRKEELFDFLRNLPNNIQFFLEVRHHDWFNKKEVTEWLLQTLRDLNIGIVITDTPGRRDCAHMNLTIDKAFIRYVSLGHLSDKGRIEDWCKRLNYWRKNGLKEIYFFIHMHEEANTPELAQYIVHSFNKNCALNLKETELLK